MTIINPDSVQVMGVINLDPASFYAGSKVNSPEDALAAAENMIADGASIIDVGGEATNPSLKNPVEALEAERERVVPVVELLAKKISVPISVDTSKPDIMREVVGAGARMINDVRALRLENALETAAALNVPVCLMHMAYPDGVPSSRRPEAQDTMRVIKVFLQSRIQACLAAGIKANHIIVDPGIGAGNFGKTLAQNLTILARLKELSELNKPILIGVSRKRFIGELLNQTPEERLPGSLAATIAAVNNGATVIRTHDVKATRDAIVMSEAIRST